MNFGHKSSFCLLIKHGCPLFLHPSVHVCMHSPISMPSSMHPSVCMSIHVFTSPPIIHSFIQPAISPMHSPIIPPFTPLSSLHPSTQSSILLSIHHLIPHPSTHLYIFCLPITHHPTISLFTDPSIYLPPLTYAPIPQVSTSGGFIASPNWEDSNTTRGIILGRTAH